MACAILVTAQSDLPKDVLQLSRLRREVGKSVATLDNYTCVETIDREERKNARRTFRHVDTVNVEVAVVNDHELYSWPGADQFEDRDLSEMVGAGLMSTGGFAATIKNVFTNNVSTIRFHGEEDILGHHAFRWDYTIPYNLSRWDVRIDGRQGRVSETGSFWADAETPELLRLEAVANDTPTDLRVSSIRETVEYSRTRVRSRDLLLPQSVETSTIKLNGDENRNWIEFSHCREFGAAAELTFGKATVPAEKPAMPVTEIKLPAGLQFSVHLIQRIDSKTASVGDRITASMDAEVRSHGAVLIPKGALFEGRIRRLERESDPRPHYMVGLEFTDIEFPGHRARFIGEMVGMAPVPGLIQAVSTLSIDHTNAGVAGTLVRSHAETEIAFKVPGVSTFFMEGQDFSIREGLEMTWLTTKLGK
jgi:hypothetical protein